MKIYNTLTRTIDELVPINPPEVKIYTCGFTVYDYAHIGHWFNYVRMDTLIRTLLLCGYKPKWVMNITDVGHLVSDADDGEDKLEKGARREGKTAWEVAAFYTDDFLDGMKIMNILTPDYIVKATEHIAEQIELVKKLEERGFTYKTSDGIYYDTSKFEGYSAFARLDLSEQQGTGRVESNPEKRNPSDFALWKFTPQGTVRDMEWDSPWGKGFPGWHIECSAMSMKYLGETLDIHTGGIDHIPVHHTNEIAQSEAATGKRFANYWMHGNHVMVDGEKISKSLGNGVRVQTLIEQGLSADVVRLHILESQYRKQSQFSLDGLEASKNRLRSLRNASDALWQPHEAGVSSDTLQAAQTSILDALQNDLNTPQALALLNAIMDSVNEQSISPEAIPAFRSFLEFLDHAFGMTFLSTNITNEASLLIEKRAAARTDQQWAESDKLRNQLLDLGIELRDTPNRGQVWNFKR